MSAKEKKFDVEIPKQKEGEIIISRDGIKHEFKLKKGVITNASKEQAELLVQHVGGQIKDTADTTSVEESEK